MVKVSGCNCRLGSLIWQNNKAMLLQLFIGWFEQAFLVKGPQKANSVTQVKIDVEDTIAPGLMPGK